MRRRPRPRRRRGRGGPDGDALAVHRPLRRRFSAPHHAPAGRGGRRRATSEASRRDGGRARRSRSPASPASALRFAERAPLLAVVGAALIRWPRDDSGGGDGGDDGDDGGGGEPDSGGSPPLALGLTLRVGARGGEVTRALALRIGRSLFAPAPGECARDEIRRWRCRRASRGDRVRDGDRRTARGGGGRRGAAGGGGGGRPWRRDRCRGRRTAAVEARPPCAAARVPFRCRQRDDCARASDGALSPAPPSLGFGGDSGRAEEIRTVCARLRVLGGCGGGAVPDDGFGDAFGGAAATSDAVGAAPEASVAVALPLALIVAGVRARRRVCSSERAFAERWRDCAAADALASSSAVAAAASAARGGGATAMSATVVWRRRSRGGAAAPASRHGAALDALSRRMAACGS